MHKEVIKPKVVRLWPTIRHALVVVIEHRRGIVEYIAVELPQGDDYLHWMAERVRRRDHPRDEETERAPGDLAKMMKVSVCSLQVELDVNGRKYRGDSLHAHDKRIRSKISRIRQRILLPQLPKQIHRGAHAGVVEHKVSYSTVK